MKLSQLLEVIGSNYQVAIYEGIKEIKKSVYQIKWHHKDLLDKEIHSVVAEDNIVCIILKQGE